MSRVIPYVLLGAISTAACAPSMTPSTAGVASVGSSRLESTIQEEVSFANGEVTLVGTLLAPGTAGPHPVAVLLSGSGPQDRDGVSPGFIPGYSPSRFLAEHLVRHGIATVRYDERGVGASSGEHGTATSGELAADAAAAVAHIRTHARIDPDRVGLVGHSEGGMLAAQVAARDADIAFVVSIAGPAVPGYELLIRQNELVFQSSGLDEAAIEQQVRAARQAMDLTVAGDWEALEALLWTTGRSELAAMSEEQRAALGDPEAYLQVQIPAVLRRYQTWMREFLTHDPAADWRRIRVPVLAVFGDLDTQVDAAQNLPAMETALRGAGNRDIEMVVLPGANHTFQPHAQTGSPAEYERLAPELMPELLELIAKWVADRMTAEVSGSASAEGSR